MKFVVQKSLDRYFEIVDNKKRSKQKWFVFL